MNRGRDLLYFFFLLAGSGLDLYVGNQSQMQVCHFFLFLSLVSSCRIELPCCWPRQRAEKREKRSQRGMVDLLQRKAIAYGLIRSKNKKRGPQMRCDDNVQRPFLVPSIGDETLMSRILRRAMRGQKARRGGDCDVLPNHARLAAALGKALTDAVGLGPARCHECDRCALTNVMHGPKRYSVKIHPYFHSLSPYPPSLSSWTKADPIVHGEGRGTARFRSRVPSRPPQESGTGAHDRASPFLVPFFFLFPISLDQRWQEKEAVMYLTCRATLKLTLQARRAQPCFPLAPSLLTMCCIRPPLPACCPECRTSMGKSPKHREATDVVEIQMI